MENYPIKSVTFGGFDKQDVIHYIEQTVADHDAACQNLQDEIARLQSRIDELVAANASLQDELADMKASKESMVAALRAENTSSEGKIAAMEAEIAKLRPDAANYAQFRERLGTIECEARERANALERSTREQLLRTVNDFNTQYTAFLALMETTTAHVNAELRKVEVNLSQLPRAMDRPNAELAELANVLKAE